MTRCEGGQVVHGCEAGSPQAEECDGLDNDCDGSTDECSPTDECSAGWYCYQQHCRVAGSRQPLDWVALPGGPFLMGDGEWPWSLPVHEVTVGAFEILRTEVTVSQYGECVAAGSCDPAEECDSGSPNAGEPGREGHPVNCVSWDQAVAFGRWVGSGARLCSEAEWEYAARSGGQVLRYPWGDEAASCDRAVMSGEGGAGCGLDRTWSVCSHPAGHNAQGVCDLAGNVREWVADGWRADYDVDDDGTADGPLDGTAWGPVGGGTRVFRGGGWLHDDPRHLRAAQRAGLAVGGYDDGLGFRLCR